MKNNKVELWIGGSNGLFSMGYNTYFSIYEVYEVEGVKKKKTLVTKVIVSTGDIEERSFNTKAIIKEAERLFPFLKRDRNISSFTVAYSLPFEEKDKVIEFLSNITPFNVGVLLKESPLSPKIILFRDKHSSSYYIVTNHKEAEKVFLKELTNRLNHSGYLNWMKDYKNDSVKPKFTKEEVDALPDSMKSEKESLLKKILQYQKEEKN